jgi:hypothetical protein
MSKVISFFAYSIAILCIIVSVATFAGNRFFAESLVGATGIRVSPAFSGGDVRRIVSFNGYEVKIHEPVFTGLFSPRKNGFVQIDFTGTSIPETVMHEIDYNDDGKKDFTITYDSRNRKGTLVSYDKSVVSLEQIIMVKNGFAARINLLRAE